MTEPNATADCYLRAMPPTDVTALIRAGLPRLTGSLRKVGELVLVLRR